MTTAALLTLVALMLPQQSSPVLNHTLQEELKHELAVMTVEVEVKAPVSPGADEALAPIMVGQAVCVADPTGRVHLVTSAFLVDGALRLRIRSQQTPEWQPAITTRFDLYKGLAELAPVESDNFRCQPAAMAHFRLEWPGSLLYSIDNPTEWTTIFYGRLADRPKPPLQDYVLASSGLPLGGPLFSAARGLATLNLRRFVIGSPYYLSAPASMIWHWVWGKRPAAEHVRRPRRGPIIPR